VDRCRHGGPASAAISLLIVGLVAADGQRVGSGNQRPRAIRHGGLKLRRVDGHPHRPAGALRHLHLLEANQILQRGARGHCWGIGWRRVNLDDVSSHPQLRDKNRRDIDKSQSQWTDHNGRISHNGPG
jgi:hypothetical protein